LDHGNSSLSLLELAGLHRLLAAGYRRVRHQSSRSEALDTLNNGDHLIVRERRLATDAVPTQQDLHDDRSIHTVPQQMARQGSDRVVTFTLADALPDEPTPMGDRMPEPARSVDRQPAHPAWQGRQI
jgi:hypothetical protein